MHFLRPQAAWLLLSLVIPVVLYLLPLPRRRLSLASILVWRRVAERQGLTGRRNLVRVIGSILLSVAVLLLIVGAFGRLIIGGGAGAAGTGRVVVVLDTSAGMQVVEGATSRFERARGHASAFVEELPAGTTTVLVTTADGPRLVVRPTDDPVTVSEALRRLGVSDAPGAMTDTLAWVERAFGRADTRVHVFTDGAFETPETKLDVTWHRFGGTVANVGIVGFGVRRVEVPERRLLVHARIGNFSTDARPVVLVLRRDGTPLDPKTVDLAAETVTAAAWTLPEAASASFDLEMTPGDRFSLDDRASAVLEPAQRRRAILVADEPPVHLLAALRADASVQTFITTPADYRAGLAGEVTLFTKTLPADLGPESVLLVNPTASTPLVTLTGAAARTGAVTWDVGHPLLADVAWRPGLVRTAVGVATPAWAETVVEGPEGPLVLAGEHEGRRVVVLTFDPETQPLVRTRTFPILVRNIVDYLAPLRDNASVVRPPRGAPVGLTTAGPQGGRTTLVPEPASAANLCDAGESDLRPRLTVDQSAGETAGGMPPAYLWTVMIIAAAALLALEAVLYHRRVLE